VGGAEDASGGAVTVNILHGDCRAVLPTLAAGSVQCCVTSPPYYGLRDYGVGGQIGLEPTPDEYVAEMVAVFREVRRVLRDDGTLWLNIGDSYAAPSKGTGGATEKQVTNAGAFFAPRKFNMGDAKQKDLMGIPWLLAFALRADGWFLRSDIIWHKPNPMPESVKGSHFTRHMVTIADYERLSGLPYIDERAGADWAGDMPGLSELETPRSKSPLRAKSQGAGHGASTRGTCGCEGEASALCCVGTREGQSGQVSEDGEGQGAHEEACLCVSGDSGRAGFRQEARGKSSRIDTAGGGRRDGAGLDSDIGTPQAPLLLLREANGEDDVGSCDPVKQRRAELAGEHRSGVRAVQQRQEGSDLPSGLVGCPGCEKCIQHHGYIFHLSAGRPTSAHEHVFLLTKRGTYFYDADAVREPHTRDWWNETPSRPGNPDRKDGGGRQGATETAGANARNVWTIATQPYSGAHFATMPPDLAERCIKAGTKPGDTVLDPFGGAGTTGLVADRLGRNATLIEINPEYRDMAAERVREDAPLLAALTQPSKKEQPAWTE